MNKLFKIFAAVLIVCSCSKHETSKLVVETDTGDVEYNIETASEITDLEAGLMDRSSLPADGGMLFDLSKVPNKVTAMWMKDTKLSLDMLFLTKEGVVYWIKENAQPYSEELIVAPFPAAAVLEINAGDVAKHQIKIGQRVKHPLFKIIDRPIVEQPQPIADKSAEQVESSNAEPATPEPAAAEPVVADEAEK